jgi:hypothetical protein
MGEEAHQGAVFRVARFKTAESFRVYELGSCNNREYVSARLPSVDDFRNGKGSQKFVTQSQFLLATIA